MTIKVFIAEKPSVAKAIINELGTVKKLNGAVLCKNNIYVTWCFGHLLEQAEPDAYLPEDIPVGKREIRFGVFKISRSFLKNGFFSRKRIKA